MIRVIRKEEVVEKERECTGERERDCRRRDAGEKAKGINGCKIKKIIWKINRIINLVSFYSWLIGF
jgi:hypothetical protein